jgi:hypothetical protein
VKTAKMPDTDVSMGHPDMARVADADMAARAASTSTMSAAVATMSGQSRP